MDSEREHREPKGVVVLPNLGLDDDQLEKLKGQFHSALVDVVGRGRGDVAMPNVVVIIMGP